MKSISIYMGGMYTTLDDREEVIVSEKEEILERETIPVSLVGQGVQWKFLKPMKEVSNPPSSEIRYSDDYIAALNSAYSFKDSVCNFPKLGRAENLFRCTFESPFERAVPECLLGDILRSSAFAGEWQPSIVQPHYIKDEFLRTPQAYLRRVEAYNPDKWRGPSMPKTFISAVALAKHEGYVFTVADSERVAIIPSQKAIEYFITRAEQIRASAED